MPSGRPPFLAPPQASEARAQRAALPNAKPVFYDKPLESAMQAGYVPQTVTTGIVNPTFTVNNTIPASYYNAATVLNTKG